MHQGTVGVERVNTRCCIVGGGPAGLMLAYLLARAGVDVLVLEKHADFLRDFRGDTIHPSTLELMHELRLLEEFLQRPHDEVRQLNGWIGESLLRLGDFTHLPTHCKFITFMPQWDFLSFLAEQARRYPSFGLLMNTEATDLLVEDALVTGVRAKSAQGQLEIRAGLTIAEMAAIPSFVKKPASKSSVSARPWMCSGCVFHALRAILRLRWAALMPANSW